MSNTHNDIFNRYSKGRATVKEQKAIDLFLDSLQETSELDNAVLTEEKGKLLLEKIEARIVYKTRKSYRTIAASVAAVFLLAGIFFTYFLVTGNEAMKTVVAKLGEKEKVILPDASVVYLNSGSSISYPVAFGEKSREVTLTGEAYFEVEHKEKHPFIITSDQFKTQVLGTKFIVSNYKGDTPAVTVVSGKVKVTDKHSSVSEIITRGQRVVYSEENHLLLKSDNVNAENYMAWKEGRVFFDHADMKQVLQTLHRRYNVVLQLNSPLYECSTISGTFSGNDVEKVLSSIRFINEMDYTKTKNDTIKITLKPCKN